MKQKKEYYDNKIKELEDKFSEIISRTKNNFEDKEKTICFIDGIEFEKPKDFGEYLELGLFGMLLLITLPAWIWFYLFGRLFYAISREKKVKEFKDEKETYYY